MSEWLPAAGDPAPDDMRPRLFALARQGQAFALATIIAADGGPRPVGSQMVVTGEEAWGFLSGGCIERDVALHGRAVLASGEPEVLVYGRGSPFIDIRLPCGGRLEVLVERVEPDEPALATLQALTEARREAWWASSGRERWCEPQAPGVLHRFVHLYRPRQRLVVIGCDPFALAIAGLGVRIGWETIVLAPFGPAAAPPVAARYDRRPVHLSLPALEPDRWTAIAVATHDVAEDEVALVPALASAAGYVGALGSRRKADERAERLRRAGLTDAAIARLHAPIGMAIGASNPWEVAVAVAAQIIDTARRAPSGEAAAAMDLTADPVDASARR